MILASRYNTETYIVESLIKKIGIDINYRTSNTGVTALMMASVHNNADTIKLLIESGANLNTTNQYGHTALILAANNGNTNITKSLINAGADINVKDSANNTALRHSIYSALNHSGDWNNIETVIILIKSNLYNNIKNNKKTITTAMTIGLIVAAKYFMGY